MVVRVLAADVIEEPCEPRTTSAVGIEGGARPALRLQAGSQGHRRRHPALLPGGSRNATARRVSRAGPWKPASAANGSRPAAASFQPAAIHSEATAALSVPATMRPEDSTWKSIARMRPCGDRPGAARVGTGSGWCSSSNWRSNSACCRHAAAALSGRCKHPARGAEQVVPGAADGLVLIPPFELQVEAAELRVHEQRVAGIGGFEDATHAGYGRIERTPLGRGFECRGLRRGPAPALVHRRGATQVGPAPRATGDRSRRSKRAPMPRAGRVRRQGPRAPARRARSTVPAAATARGQRGRREGDCQRRVHLSAP